MAFLDFIINRNAAPTERPTHIDRPEIQVPKAVENLPDHVKAQAVEAARPAAQLMDQATTPKTISAQPEVPHTRERGRSLGMER
jgi:hypothetical protein